MEHEPEALRRARWRLRAAVRTIIQTAVAVAGSWLLATEVLGYDQPFFAPIAAVITVSASPGAPARRALELGVGVTLGIAVGDLLILGIGTGPLQIVLVVVLAMIAANLASGSVLVVNQAAISAILVATLMPPTITLVPHRVFHAAIGGAIGVLVGQILLRRPPLPSVAKASRPVYDGLATVLTDTAAAIRAGDATAAERALLAARALDPDVRSLHQTLADTREIAFISLSRRGTRDQLERYEESIRQLDLAVRNTRVLARAAIALLRSVPDDEPRLQDVGDAVEDLAAGVQALGAQLTGDGAASTTQQLAMHAATHATELFPDRASLSLARVVGQVRATSVDLLRGSGLDLWEANQRLEMQDAEQRDDS